MPKSRAPGDKISELMDEKGWSEQRLEEESGVRQSTINHIRNGGDPQVSTVKKLADGFGVDPEELI